MIFEGEPKDGDRIAGEREPCEQLAVSSASGRDGGLSHTVGTSSRRRRRRVCGAGCSAGAVATMLRPRLLAWASP